jgi:hypothetical protein
MAKSIQRELKATESIQRGYKQTAVWTQEGHKWIKEDNVRHERRIQ